MQAQITALKAAADALAAKTDQLVTVSATLVTTANTLKTLLEQAIAGTLTPADRAALDTASAELTAATDKLQGVIQSETDANTVDQPNN